MFVHAYQSYIFNEFLKEIIKKKARYSKGQLFGYESKIENEIERKILGKEKIEPKDFFIRSMPEMSSKGEKRELFINLKDFKVVERGKGYYVVRFSLPKGCYATTVIDQLFT
jgi:tRNA pseudouridine13 synthase